jgi:hypothetical protein
MPILQTIQLFQLAAQGVFPCPKMMSWPGHFQSQEAVIEAVGGG